MHWIASKLGDLDLEEKEHFHLEKIWFSIRKNDGCRNLDFWHWLAGWLWLALAGSGWLWLALAGFGLLLLAVACSGVCLRAIWCTLSALVFACVLFRAH